MQQQLAIASLLFAGLLSAEGTLLRNGAKPPAKDEMDSFALSFEIKNFDYFGLTNSWSDPWADEVEDAPVAKSISTNVKGANADNEIDKIVKNFNNAMDNMEKKSGQVQKSVHTAPSSALQFSGKDRECWRPSDALVKQIIETEDSPLTMMDAMRTAIKTAIEGAIECEQIKKQKLYDDAHAGPGWSGLAGLKATMKAKADAKAKAEKDEKEAKAKAEKEKKDKAEAKAKAEKEKKEKKDEKDETDEKDDKKGKKDKKEKKDKKDEKDEKKGKKDKMEKKDKKDENNEKDAKDEKDEKVEKKNLLNEEAVPEAWMDPEVAYAEEHGWTPDLDMDPEVDPEVDTLVGFLQAAPDKKEDKADEKEEKKDDKKEDKKDTKPARSNIHITFRPGNEEPNLSLLDDTASMLNKPQPSLVQASTGKNHWSVIVDVTITEGPNNGATDLVESQKFVRKALLSGQLKDSLRGAIYEVTGDAPDVRNLNVTAAMIKQWNIDKCETHLTKMVNTFTLHYTRAQVPAALYNECTNFMPKMSFSLDHILDSGDAARCRKATRVFTKHWKFGKNAQPEDFQQICLETCEAKFGKLAPRCHVTEGKKLKALPHF